VISALPCKAAIWAKCAPEWVKDRQALQRPETSARDSQNHLVHASGLCFILTHGYGVSGLVTADARLAILQASNIPMGVPVHQTEEGVQSLANEAHLLQ